MVTKPMQPWYTTVTLPKGRVFQLDTDLDNLYVGLEDIGIGPRYAGEIRKGQWYVELGGPKHQYKSVQTIEVMKDPDDVVDGRVEIIGPELNELPVETSLPFALHVRVWGSELQEELTEFVERGTLLALLFMEGWGVVGARDMMWLRVSKEMAPKMSFLKMAQAIRASTISLMPIVERVEVKWVIASPEVGGREIISKMLDETKPKWEALDARTKGMSDEEVDTFYGCTICKMIAPNHACIVTPSLVPYCGILSYFSAKAMYAVDPYGYIFEVPRGKTVDPIAGRFTGVDDTIWDRSDHKHQVIHLHSCIRYPTTN